MLNKNEIATFQNVVTRNRELRLDKLKLAQICDQAMTAIDLDEQVKALQEAGRAVIDADPDTFQTEPEISLEELLSMPRTLALDGEETLKNSVLTAVPTNGTIVTTTGGNKPCEDTNQKSSPPSSPRAKPTQR